MSTTESITQARVYAEVWGRGEPVVLVHGSLATGNDEWGAQLPLVHEGFALTVFDRRGYGRSEPAAGEDYLVDAADVVELLGNGAHLVGHSYGGLGAMFAATQRPEAVRSLTLLEPAAASASSHPEWRALMDSVAHMWSSDAADLEWVVEFLTAVGSDPSELPAELVESAAELAPLLRNGRSFHDAVLPLDLLAAAPFPKLVVSGAHAVGWDAMCADLAARIGGRIAFVPGAGHEIQFAGDAINELLAQFWRSAR